MATATVGPVIGKVTDRRARILVEADRDTANVVCVAIGKAGDHDRCSPRDLKKNRATAFDLKNLSPETEYEITFENLETPVTGRIKTYSSNLHRMNVAAVSCNYTTRRSDTDLWADLLERYVKPGDMDLLLHVGDQVYGDSRFETASQILGSRRSGTKRQEAQILELYRDLYRRTWTRHQPTREVLARVPNLMIWDDHEIRDDWGSLDADKDPNSKEHYIGRLARQVFREYQRQLWDDFDPDAPPASGFEDHMHKWGPIGVLFVDQRGGRSFETDPERPYLGRPQWDRIRKALCQGGFFDDVRALLVITSVPLAYLGSRVSTLGSFLADDLKDHWAYGSHQKEQIEFVRLLRVWKGNGNASRELLLLGGDVHVGGYTDIRRGKDVIFKQLVTSPITNKPPHSLQFAGLRRVLLEVNQNLGSSYSFEHHDFLNRRNYGIVLVRVPEQGTPRMEGSLVAES